MQIRVKPRQPQRSGAHLYHSAKTVVSYFRNHELQRAAKKPGIVALPLSNRHTPAIPYTWMESKVWQGEPMHWAASAYHQLAPRVNVKGRMALILLLAVVWAFGWYAVIQNVN